MSQLQKWTLLQQSVYVYEAVLFDPCPSAKDCFNINTRFQKKLHCLESLSQRLFGQSAPSLKCFEASYGFSLLTTDFTHCATQRMFAM